MLIDRLGLRFTDRPGSDPAKRPVREIVGIDGELPRLWSKRRAVIDARRAELSAAFQRDHGRPPGPTEAIALAQHANLETRQAKHQPRSYVEQRAAWHGEALAILGDERDLTAYVDRALKPGATRQRPVRPTPAWIEQAVDSVLINVQRSRATWQENHVRAEAERYARSAGVAVRYVDSAVGAVVTTALHPERSIALTGGTGSSLDAGLTIPQSLLRRDGSSVYSVAGAALYTSREVLAAEQAVVAAAGQRGGRVVDPTHLEEAFEKTVCRGVDLNPGQEQLVRELATSGLRVQLALAPAGTGKTTAMRALAHAWTQSGGNVVGLAPSAVAAAVLRDELEHREAHADTLAKLVHALKAADNVPDWVTRIGKDTLVMVDEAGMAGTIELAEAIKYITDRGGSVRLIGDDQQLASIGAGGVLRDVATTHGAVTLSQVVRFTHPDTGAPNHAEGAASLALRDGDTAAIAYYIDNGRVHVGDITTVTDDAYNAWSADRAAGRDAIMLAPTRDLVAELNDRARRDRLDALHATDTPTGREVRLVDGSHASAGDAIITRKNNRTLAITATDWVKNGDRWSVDAIRHTGALDVVHLRTGRHVTLPADYVAANVSLGYASTVHGAQGITADASYTVATGDESRQLLYVAMTRGRHSNHVFLTTASNGDPHSVITRDAVLPPTAVDMLTRMLVRDGAPVSASSAERAATDPAKRLGAGADRYFDALGFAAADHLGPARLAAIDTAAETARPGLTQLDGFPALRSHLALMAVDGHDPADVLHQAISNGRGLDDVRDAAAVLDWRLDPTGRRSAGAGPLPWLPAVPAALQNSTEWGSYLTHNAAVVTATAAAVADRARVWTPTSAPLWAAPLIDRDADLVAELAVWRAAHHINDGDRRPTGPALAITADARAQRGLDQRVIRLLGDPIAATGRWTPLADSVDHRIATDAYWPTLANRLIIADRAGIDVTNLVRTVGAELPLPDAQPAAVLWWRLSRHLAPAAMTATDHSISNTLRPDWTPTLTDVVGATAAERIQAHPGRPALVAAITGAGQDRWQSAQLLTTAYDSLRSGRLDNQPLRLDELATALVWRIGILTDTAPAALEAYFPPKLDNPVPVIPADLDLLGSLVVDLDDDWLASLSEPDTDADPTAGDDQDETAPPPDANKISVGAAYMVPFNENPTDTAHNVGTRADEGSPRDIARVPRERLVDLNAQAAEFFAARYLGSWAADYLTGRLGADLIDDDRFVVGYAPDSWTALTRHLRRYGAADNEIVAAGLGTYVSIGRVIDRFRDRLVVPIQAIGPHGQVEIQGWVGRRNPLKGDADHTGPKYLNTSNTDLFTKGNQLFGLVENAAALAAGATPTLVEGPMDAIAVTLAGDGTYVGVAPLGTAFTDVQADALRPYLGDDRPGVIVATDADAAGQQAAHRAFWQLTARGDNPRHLLTNHAGDPAELLRLHGPTALKKGLRNAAALADTVITDCIGLWSDRLDTVEGRVYSARAAAQVIAALPPTTWPAYLTDIVTNTRVSHHTALQEVLEAHTAWAAGPLAAAMRHLADRLPESTDHATNRKTQNTAEGEVDDIAQKAASDGSAPSLSIQTRSAAQRDNETPHRTPRARVSPASAGVVTPASSTAAPTVPASEKTPPRLRVRSSRAPKR